MLRAAPLTCLLSLALFAVPTPAQGVLQLNGGFRLGTVGSYFGAPCTGQGFFSDDATVVFQPDGTFTATFNVTDVCPGIPSSLTVDNCAGDYDIQTDGKIVLDFDPLQPGTDTMELYINGDLDMMVGSRSTCDPDAGVIIAIRRSFGQSLASLNGDYHIVRFTGQNPVSGTALRRDLGVMTFDGAGAWTETSERHFVPLGGVGATSPYTANGSYFVDSVGNLVLGAAVGLVSENTEVFFATYAPTAGSEVELLVGVRKGSSYGNKLIKGDYSVGAVSMCVGSGSPGGPVLDTDLGVDTFTPTAPGSGSMVANVYAVCTNQAPPSTVCGPISYNDNWVLSSTGQVSFASATPNGALSSDGTFMLISEIYPEGMGFRLGLGHCEWPNLIGTPTSGTGGRDPAIKPKWFPNIGNQNFGIEVSNTPSMTPGYLLLSQSSFPAGFPIFGGQLYVLGAFATYPILTSGLGSSVTPIPLRPNPNWVGFQFTAQALLIDSGAPGGISMTAGLEVTLCR